VDKNELSLLARILGGEEMKVKELIKLLQEHNQDEEVRVTWERIFCDADFSHCLSNIENIYLAANGKVIIDADGNCYEQKIKNGEGYYIP